MNVASTVEMASVVDPKIRVSSRVHKDSNSRLDAPDRKNASRTAARTRAVCYIQMEAGNPAGSREVDTFRVEGPVRLLRERDAVPAAGSEAVLVEGCRAGDRSSQEGLYRLYRTRVYNLVLRIGGEQDAEELCQEVFIKIFRNIGKFRGEAAIGTWIYRLAVNAALTHVTRKPREKSLEDIAWEEPAVPAAPRDPRLRERIEHAMTALPGGYRAVMVLHDIEGLSHEEIANILGCTIGTSKSQLFKARQKMRELLGPVVGRELRS